MEVSLNIWVNTNTSSISSKPNSMPNRILIIITILNINLVLAMKDIRNDLKSPYNFRL